MLSLSHFRRDRFFRHETDKECKYAQRQKHRYEDIGLGHEKHKAYAFLPFHEIPFLRIPVPRQKECQQPIGPRKIHIRYILRLDLEDQPEMGK